MFTRKIEHLITCDAHSCGSQLAPSSEASLGIAAAHILNTLADERVKLDEAIAETFKAFAKASGWLSTGSGDVWRCPACVKRGGSDGEVCK